MLILLNLVLQSYLVVRTWFCHNNLFSLLFLFALSDISVSPDLRDPIAMLVQKSCAMGILLKRTQVERRVSLEKFVTHLLRGNHDRIFRALTVFLLLPLWLKSLCPTPAKHLLESVRVVVAGKVEHCKVVEICQICKILSFLLFVFEVLDDRTVVSRVQEGFQLTRFRAERVECERVDAVEEGERKLPNVRIHSSPWQVVCKSFLKIDIH